MIEKVVATGVLLLATFETKTFTCAGGLFDGVAANGIPAIIWDDESYLNPGGKPDTTTFGSVADEICKRKLNGTATFANWLLTVSIVGGWMSDVLMKVAVTVTSWFVGRSTHGGMFAMMHPPSVQKCIP